MCCMLCFSSRRRHTRCALVTGVQTCALPISEQPDKSRAYFGATVTVADEDDNHRTVTLVGDDEADASAGRIGWNAPLARALRGATVGDLRKVTLPSGEKEYEVVEITYPR